MFRNNDTKKNLNTPKIVPNPHNSLCDTDLPTSRLQFYFNFKSYNEMWSLNSVIFI